MREGHTKHASLLLAVLAAGCSGPSGQDASLDTGEDEGSEDGAADCIDDAPAPGDAAFTTTECGADPAVAVIEVQLTTMEIRSWAASAPESELTLTPEQMRDLLLSAVVGNGCSDTGTGWLADAVPEVTEMGPFSWLLVDGGDPLAGALFDKRTGEMILTTTGDWMSIEERCTPEPMESVQPSYAAAGGPAACHTASDVACEDEISWLNTWGETWASCRGSCWFERTYDETWDLVSHTRIANALAACGPYAMFVHGLSTPGGWYCGDPDMNRMLFVLSGHADESVLEP